MKTKKKCTVKYTRRWCLKRHQENYFSRGIHTHIERSRLDIGKTQNLQKNQKTGKFERKGTLQISEDEEGREQEFDDEFDEESSTSSESGSENGSNSESGSLSGNASADSP